jgi:ribosomal subunit interface protein
MSRDDHRGDVVDIEPEIRFTSHHAEMRDLYLQQINDRLSRLGRYDGRVTRYEVELDHEANPRQAETSHRVAITGRGTGPTVHAEACAADFRAALDGATGKLEEQLRRRRDRRRVRHDRAHRATVTSAPAPTR